MENTAAADPDEPRGGLLQANTRRWYPVWQLTLARTKEFYREPEAIFWVYGFPLLMAVALGIAFREQPQQTIAVDIQAGPFAQNVAIALARQDHAQANSSTTSANPRFKVRVTSAEQARQRLQRGKISLVVVPVLATADQLSGSRASGEQMAPSNIPLADLRMEYLFDPNRPEANEARRAVDDALQRGAGRADPLAVANVDVAAPGGRYIDFLIPGLIGLSLLGGGMFGVGFVAVEMRSRHLLKRFVTTPMRKSHFMAGMMLSRFGFSVSEVILLLAFAAWFFEFRVLGSYVAVLVFFMLGALAFSGLGLLVASRAKTIETVSGLMNLVMMPMWLLSGAFFSYERFPEATHPFIKLLPLTPLCDGLRAVMNEGASLRELMPEVSILTVWTVVTFVLALRLFRWY